jgi:DNA-binding response OmpR family regulator
MGVVNDRGMRERRRRVLVVEDDRALADMYRTALRFSGFDVDGATDGVSALRLIDQSVPDVVVLDLHLPRLRGEAILQEITNRADLCDIPVIIVTGADPSPAVAQAAAILRKPCPPDRLLSIIDRVSEAA